MTGTVALDPDLERLLMPVEGTNSTFAARLFARVDFTGDCWEWTGCTFKGYGRIRGGAPSPQVFYVHRAMWEMLVGSIPAGLEYDHLCRNRRCCNPSHGEIVTTEVNKARGFSVTRLASLRPTCRYGHPKDGTYGAGGSKRRGRFCKTCKRISARVTAREASPPLHPDEFDARYDPAEVPS